MSVNSAELPTVRIVPALFTQPLSRFFLKAECVGGQELPAADRRDVLAVRDPPDSALAARAPTAAAKTWTLSDPLRFRLSAIFLILPGAMCFSASPAGMARA